MRICLVFLNLAMLATAFAELCQNGSYALSAGLFAIAALSGAALFFAVRLRGDSNRPAYEMKLKAIQGMTMVCAFFSLYWPYDVYYNISLLVCLVFHVLLRKYAK